LRQWDALSSILINIAFEEVIREVLNTGIGIKLQDQKVIKLLAYSDDIVILMKSIDLQIMTHVLIHEGKQTGLTINEDMTKFMIQSRKNLPLHNLRIEEMEFERVDT